MKRLTAILLALLTFVLPAFAGGEESVPGPDEFVPEIMGEYFRSDENYAIAFRSMYDGETWLWNSDEYFKVASVYKLPLNMYFYELEAAGEIAPDESIYGVPLDYCHEQSLVYSNNELSQLMVDWIGSYRQFKEIAFGYTGLDESERSFDYYASGGFTARMMVGMLQTLWDDPETFWQEIEYLKQANPGEYLKSGECGLEIAQKYGYEHYDGVLNICIAGIVYTDEPFLITVLTRGVGWAEVLMGELCDAFAEYEQTRERVEPVPPETGAEGPSVQPVSALLDAARLALRLAGFPFAAGLI